MTITPQTNASLAEIAEVLRAGNDFILCGHVSPDGDCLGSQLALFHTLKAMGKHVTCVLVKNEPLNSSLSFMPGAADMIPASDYQGSCSVFVALDVPNRDRIGQAACKLLDQASVSVTVDHHASETTMSQHVYVDPDCASTSMLVWEIANLLLDKPPVETALCAYVGLVTDTGGFRFQNCDSDAFAVAAELVAYGVDPAVVATNLFQNRSIPSLKLEALAIDRLQVICDGQAAISWISEDDLAKYNANKSDVEPLIDTVRAIEGTRVACMLREQDGVVRGNLRSKDSTDVSALARKFGGGGHTAAAGFTLDMPLDTALDLLKTHIAELFD